MFPHGLKEVPSERLLSGQLVFSFKFVLLMAIHSELKMRKKEAMLISQLPVPLEKGQHHFLCSNSASSEGTRSFSGHSKREAVRARPAGEAAHAPPRLQLCRSPGAGRHPGTVPDGSPLYFGSVMGWEWRSWAPSSLCPRSFRSQ